MTERVVLKQVAGAVEGQSGGGHWEEVGQYEARSAQDAVASYLKAHGLKGGVFAAVPRRSFKPITVEAETQTRLKFK